MGQKRSISKVYKIMYRNGKNCAMIDINQSCDFKNEP